MNWSGLKHRLYEAVRPGRADADLANELRDHVEREIERQVASGLSPYEARRAALAKTGAVRATHEYVRDERSGRVIADAIADLRLGLRGARRNPGFSAAVIASLALGVGGTTAVFSVVEAVLLRPLPYAQPDRLFMLRVWWNDFSATLSPADLLAVQETSRDIANVGAFFLPDDGFALMTPTGPEVVKGAVVTEGLPGVLGVAALLGPGFSSRQPIREALVSETFWRDRLGASAAAIGRSITLDGDAYVVVGVMPAGFNVPGQRDGAVWAKALLRQPTRRGAFYLNTIARVSPDLTAHAAASRMTAAVAPVLRERYGVDQTWRYGLRPVKEALVGEVRQTLVLLLGAMALVLLIAIVNVSNLLVSRGTTRGRELAVRASLGAERGRLARQLLTESALLGLVGGGLGLRLASVLLKTLVVAVAQIVPRVAEVQLNGLIVGFALLSGVGAGLLAGVLPAMRVPWSRLAMLLREGGRPSGEGPARARARQVLVVAEIALTVTVLTAAVLLSKSMLRLQAADPGFTPKGVLSFRLSLPDDPYDNDERLSAFLAALERRLRATGGVSSVAFALALPPDRFVLSNNYTIEGASAPTAGPSGVAEWNVATPDYFSALNIRLIAGRGFGSEDRASSARVAIVNESFVRRHYPDGQAVGRRFKGGDWDPAAPWTTIVGVVTDVPYAKGVWGGADATVYLPYSQNLWWQSPYVVVKTEGDPSRLVSVARQAVMELDRSVPLRDVATMEQRLRLSMVEPRVRSVLFALIAGLALALAVTGIYGVMAYHVTQRRRDTAIRRALGARASEVVAATIAAGLRLTLAGVLLGTAGATMVTRTLSTMLFRVSPHDPTALAAVAAILTGAAALACAVPAVRTARIDPAAVLRDE